MKKLVLLLSFIFLLTTTGCSYINEDIENEESSSEPVTLSVSDLEDALDALDLTAASLTYHNEADETYPASAAIRAESYVEKLENFTWKEYLPASEWTENDSFFIS